MHWQWSSGGVPACVTSWTWSTVRTGWLLGHGVRCVVAYGYYGVIWNWREFGKLSLYSGRVKKGTISFVQLLFETKQIMSFRILLWSPTLQSKKFLVPHLRTRDLEELLLSLHPPSKLNHYPPYNINELRRKQRQNSDNIDVNQMDISKNSNRVIAPERSQRTREFDNVLRCVGNWENHPRGEYVLPCR